MCIAVLGQHRKLAQKPLIGTHHTETPGISTGTAVCSGMLHQASWRNVEILLYLENCPKRGGLTISKMQIHGSGGASPTNTVP